MQQVYFFFQSLASLNQARFYSIAGMQSYIILKRSLILKPEKLLQNKYFDILTHSSCLSINPRRLITSEKDNYSIRFISKSCISSNKIVNRSISLRYIHRLRNL